MSIHLNTSSIIHGLARICRSGALTVLGLALCGAVAPERADAAPLLLSAGQKAGAELGRMLDDLGRRRADVVTIQRELVARPAVGPEDGGVGEEQKARWIEEWLTERGMAYERLDFPDVRVSAKVRPNIVAVYPQWPERIQDAARTPTLWLLSHMDVAKAGPRDLWQGDPFALRVDGDTLYGRGAEDNNQAITVSLLLLESLRQTDAAPSQRRNGVTRPMRLGLVITSGALTGYACGIGHVVNKRPDLFRPEDLIVVMDYGNAAGNLVGVGEKGNLWLKIIVTGKSGHAGRPDKANNAFAAGAALAHALGGLGKNFPTENALFTPPCVTITPTRVEDYSTGINHIPEIFIFYADVRVTPDYSFADAEKAVRGLADAVERDNGVSITIERVEETPTARVTPENAPVLAALDRAIRAQLGVEPHHTGTGSVTMASVLRDKGLNVAVWGVQETMHNRAEEYARISAHIKQAQVLARMLFEALPTVLPETLDMDGAANGGALPDGAGK